MAKWWAANCDTALLYLVVLGIFTFCGLSSCLHCHMCFWDGDWLSMLRRCHQSTFSGKEQFPDVGIRGSMELIGGASRSLLVGQLLKIHWTFAFLIYSLGFVILTMYPSFCANDGSGGEEAEYKKWKQGLNKKKTLVWSLDGHWQVVICSNSSISLRASISGC